MVLILHFFQLSLHQPQECPSPETCGCQGQECVSSLHWKEQLLGSLALQMEMFVLLGQISALLSGLCTNQENFAALTYSSAWATEELGSLINAWVLSAVCGCVWIFIALQKNQNIQFVLIYNNVVWSKLIIFLTINVVFLK